MEEEKNQLRAKMDEYSLALEPLFMEAIEAQ